nr:T9SS type A sorting domain-containing protein [Bacteroidota bacterium]
QSDRELGTRMSAAQRTEILNNVANAPKSKLVKSTLSCDSIAVDSVAGNGYHGNMFDISVTSSVTLETFSVSMDAGTWNVAIFYKMGTYVGSESASTGWIFLDSANITSTFTGAGGFNKVPVNLNMPLNAGSTYAFYVTGTSSSTPLNYTNGTSVGTVAASNTYFSVLEGAGGAYPFTVTNSPRIFNGEVFFCAGVTGINENTLGTVELFPNPADQSVSVDLNAFNGNKVTLTVINTLGQLLQSTSLMANGITTLNLDEYPAGMYFVQLEMNGKTTTSKLSVK